MVAGIQYSQPANQAEGSVRFPKWNCTGWLSSFDLLLPELKDFSIQLYDGFGVVKIAFFLSMYIISCWENFKNCLQSYICVIDFFIDK